MNPSCLKIEKSGKIVLIAVRVVQAVIVLSIAASTLMLVLPEEFLFPKMTRSGDFWITTFSNLFTNAVFLFILFLTGRFLQTLRKASPFLRENVKRLKTISALLIAVEPVQIIFQWISNAVRPAINGQKEVFVTSYGGIIFVLGFVVFCLALVFEYGMELQKQSDETL
ncbi:hypothetical protein CAFE_35790 [Caprobacter fermentans]|uniref:DUF2975 domain-containing protein n=1 Tax=Caproicibacter fermentans TaxID=2576756 RepID=A0A6N8I5P1_9FIRM|nr:DUF2975 domain-containing protein [Caproicibacter fermentans]MVB12833.1 hypothetical protein [Caproicibacter fermentans]OCN02186.1 hypothetical protein A7X67_12290 [Clostridium sp. W14A]QNK41406.1 DUF2975 domain-containing protein [Caproicibacter fermentans]